MNNSEIIICLLAFAVMLALFLAVIMRRCIYNFREIRIFKVELNRAENLDEYAHWKREISALRWSSVTGLSPRKVKRIKKNLKVMFGSENKVSDTAMSLVMPSVLGICICAVCLAGSSYAWFTASQDVSSGNISSARYEVVSTVTQDDVSTSTRSGQTEYKFYANHTYTVTLKANEDAPTGYCIITFKPSGDGAAVTHITQQFPSAIYPSNEIEFKVTVYEDVTMTISSSWGSSASTGEKLDDNEIITFGTPPEPQA